jgi:hypothetical protein
MVPFDLEEDARVVLDASGNGSVVLGPKRMRQVWKVTSLSVATNSVTDEPIATVYGPMGTTLGGTYSGSKDTTDLNVTLPYGSRIKVQWTNGDPGAIAIASVQGTVIVR